MVAGNTLLKFLFGQMLDQLREDGAARVHPSSKWAQQTGAHFGLTSSRRLQVPKPD
jgi:hypothetical protein